MSADLSAFDNSWYSPGRGVVARALWFFLGLPLLRSAVIPSSAFRVALLRLFGARIGRKVVIKPGVRVKYPWLLSVGSHTWIGEDAWLDNLARVTLGDSVCVSQGAYICTGNHDWSDPAFGLMLGPVTLESGAWACDHTVIGPGVILGEGAVVTAGSVVSHSVPPFEIHSGNPAVFVRTRRHGLPALRVHARHPADAAHA
jgi:putative colanic acid biosynthesis acetyltransferase WcaF